MLPDNWDTNYYHFSNTNQCDASFSSNIISVTAWSNLEQHGAIFLPASGFRWGISVFEVGSRAEYWSASSYSSEFSIYCIHFNNSSLSPQNPNSCTVIPHHEGASVRLVYDVE